MADGWGSSGGNDGWGTTTASNDGWGASGDAGGAPKKKGCFKCGEEGHMSKDCKKPEVCRKCNEEGHMSKECTKKDTCRKCNEEGHMSRDCTKPETCRKCNEEGHISKECPNAGPETCRKCKKEGHMAAECELPDICFKCKKEGHMSKDCELPDVCFKCKKEGHMSKDCELPDTCFRCGAEGHTSKDCTEEMKTRIRENDDGTKSEIYVPKEVDDANLFQQGIGSGINFDKFDNIPVRCSGENVPKPVKTFEEAALRKLLLDNIEKSGYTKPTPIQKVAIPCILAKRDLMGCAQTGSGKTAAFLLPILHTLLQDGCDPNSGASTQSPQAVIVAPTRELAVQIKDEARKFSNGSVIKSVVAYGGTSTGFQLQQLQKGCNILIATPGRLMDFVEKGKVTFENVRYLVLDEADRMLDMGFLPEIQRIVAAASMPAKGTRQTLMFSATFPEEVQHLAVEFLQSYLFLAIGIVGGACADVDQKFFEVEKFGKRDKLKEILQDAGTDRTLIFVETKRNADFLATFLSGEGFPTTSIHGDRLQREREEALADFKTGKMPILVATAVAARGLDIKGVAHVINYDLPKSVDEYVHRIGRTGRVGNKGKASSFYDGGENSEIAGALVKILGDSQQEVPEFLSASSGGFGGASTFGGSDIRGGGQAAAVEEEEW